MLEKCFGCAYVDDKLSAPCAFHAVNPDETTHDGIVAGVEQLVLEQLELATERKPYEAPEITDVTDPAEAERLRDAIIEGETELAVLVDDEAPKTPRDRS